jgi:hypothetical protein
MAAPAGAREVALGEIRFRAGSFRELVRYVVRGGWPRWENDAPPEYVAAMQDAIATGDHWATGGGSSDA